MVMIKMMTVILMINDYYDDSDIKEYNGNDNAYYDLEEVYASWKSIYARGGENDIVEEI